MGDVSKGQIREGLGTALFNVHYSCLVLRPHKGEVMDCVVTSVSKVKLRKHPVQSCLIASHVRKGLPGRSFHIRLTFCIFCLGLHQSADAGRLSAFTDKTNLQLS